VGNDKPFRVLGVPQTPRRVDTKRQRAGIMRIAGGVGRGGAAPRREGRLLSK
jgi:hypothetical protein